MTKPHPESDPRLIAENDENGLGEEDASSPERQCAVTRERLPKAAMLRFVLSPDGVVTPDISERLPGRGVWVKAERSLIEQAAKKGAFARGFKTQVKVPEGLCDLIERLLLKRCVDTLALARKAGQAICGFDQVRDALRGGYPAFLLEAADGAEDGRSKVYFLAKALYSDVKVAGALSAPELGMAFGRDRVIHGLVRRGAIAETWEIAYRRLIGFREAPELTWFQETDR
ncbi:MAG: RNA-binding protein [Hyphomonas sp.]